MPFKYLKNNLKFSGTLLNSAEKKNLKEDGGFLLFCDERYLPASGSTMRSFVYSKSSARRAEKIRNNAGKFIDNTF